MGQSGAVCETGGGGTDVLDLFVGTVTANVIASAPYASAISDTPSDEAANATVTDAMSIRTSQLVPIGAQSGTAATNPTATLPTSSAGDLMLLALYYRQASASNITDPVGWTRIQSALDGSGNRRLFLWWRIRVGGDANVAFTGLGSECVWGTVAFAAAQLGVTPVDASATSSSASTTTMTGAIITPSVANCTIVEVMGANTNNPRGAATHGVRYVDTGINTSGSSLNIIAWQAAAQAPTVPNIITIANSASAGISVAIASV